MNRKFRFIRVFIPAALVAIVGVVAGAARAHALTNLKQVKVAGGDQVALLFDQEIRPGQVKVEYLRDIIQISIRDVSVYPAKILNVDGGELTKVFAYQYTPSLIRTRLTVRGNADSYHGRVRLNHRGKLISVHIDSPPGKTAAGQGKSDRITTQSAQATRGSGAPDPKEKELLERVLKGKDGDSKSGGKLTADRPLPSPLRAFGWLSVIVGAIAGLAVFVRAGGKGRGVHRRLEKGFLSRVLGGALKRPNRLIEITATHQLGPKRSIVVARIRGRTLVLGITNESINLIADLTGSSETGPGSSERVPSELEADLRSMGISRYSGGTGATAAGPAVFSELLGQETEAEVSPSGISPESSGYRHPASGRSSVRERIRSKMRDMKSL